MLRPVERQSFDCDCRWRLKINACRQCQESVRVSDVLKLHVSIDLLDLVPKVPTKGNNIKNEQYKCSNRVTLDLVQLYSNTNLATQHTSKYVAQVNFA